jgi:hypothetical protein
MKWVGHVACIWNARNVYKSVVGKLKRKTSIGRHKYKWDYSIKMKHKGIECKGADWIELVHNRDQ